MEFWCGSDRTAGRICRRFALFGGVVGLLVLASLVAASPAQASYDGRNGLVAFVADSGNGVQLYTVRSNGHGLRQITPPERRRRRTGLVA